MADHDRDLAYIEALGAELKAYLLGKDLYWPLGGVLPRGTLGGLFLRLHRLGSAQGTLTDTQQMKYTNARAQIEDELGRWHVQAEEKILREIKARIGAWDAYIDELEQNARRYAPDYPTQAAGRTIIVFLMEYAGKAINGQGFTSRLIVLDKRLSNMSEDDAFVWDEVYQSAFPREAYWWLYIWPTI